MKDQEVWPISALSRRGWLYAVSMCLFALFLRSWCLGFPAETYFDETYYGPAALDYIEGRPDSNTVHPPLGKIQIAAGILGARALNAYWGSELCSEAVQRRVTCVAAGTLMVAVTFMLAYRVSRGSRLVALMAAFLLAIDFMAVTMSRVCMLDTINALWILIGVYCCWRYLEGCWRGANSRRVWAVLCALSVGIATACKWNGLFAGGACWLAMVLFREHSWALTSAPQLDEKHAESKGAKLKAVSPSNSSQQTSYLCTLWREGWKPALQLGVLFSVVCAVVYVASYTPLFMRMGFGEAAWREIWGYHTMMISFRYDAKQFTHGYLSYFWSWPLVLRPIWLYFESGEAKDVVNGIVSFGSVPFWWTFLYYLIESLVDGIKRKDAVRLFLVLMWLVQWLAWASSTTGGFIYYMLPVVPIMAVLTAVVLDEWRCTGGGWMVVLYLVALAVAFVAYWDFLTGQSTTMAHFSRLFPAWASGWR